MNVTMFLYIAALFVVLSPSILFKFPTKGSPLVIAITHGLLFAIVYHFTHRYVWSLSEGFSSANRCATNIDCTGENQFCYSYNSQCTSYKSLGKGEFCDSIDTCINGCDMANKVCY